MSRFSLSFFLCVALSVSVLAQRAECVKGLEAFDIWNADAHEMAYTTSDLSKWDKYPTYNLYLHTMQSFVELYPHLCHLDTMGFSVLGRPILVLRVASEKAVANAAPQFLYAASIHGDEMIGTLLALHLVDTLLASYGMDGSLTNVVDSVQIFIAPLSNPDGAYYEADDNVDNAQRCNANGVDLNRNFPSSFYGSNVVVQPENEALLSFVASHRIVLSAHLHAGAEVLNYPWDCKRYSFIKHPDDKWWREVCQNLVAVARKHDASSLSSVTSQGYIAGGEWYVVNNGCQDYLNYYCGAHNLTIELSVDKMPQPSRVSSLWHTYADMLIEYIAYARKPIPHCLVPDYSEGYYMPFPNPAGAVVFLATPTGLVSFDISNAPHGLNFIEYGGKVYKIIKM